MCTRTHTHTIKETQAHKMSLKLFIRRYQIESPCLEPHFCLFLILCLTLSIHRFRQSHRGCSRKLLGAHGVCWPPSFAVYGFILEHLLYRAGCGHQPPSAMLV